MFPKNTITTRRPYKIVLLAHPNVFLVLYMYVNSGVMSIIVLPTDLEITVRLSSTNFLLNFECKRHTVK